MEEKKTLKIKKPYLIIFTLAIAFAIMGFIDLKVNAVDGYAVNVQYITHGYDGSGNEIETRVTDLGSIVSTASVDAYYYTSYDKPVATAHKYTVFLVSEQPMTDNDIQTTLNGTTVYICMFGPVNAGLYYDGGGYLEPLISGNRYSYDLNTDYYDISAFATALSSNTLDCEQIIDWSEFLKNASVNDDMPCVTNLDFDRIESTDSNKKSITDYIRFDPNSDYRLAILLCPSVYSSIRSNGFISKFEHYDYDEWIFMTTSDVGLKEISCNIGTFSIPTSGVGSIVESNYKRYYETILYGLSDNGSVNFKPTMGYRLMYVDLSNNQIGPSTYILPNYYDNLDPNDETCSFFTLYSNGTKGSEKVMNLKTWQQDESMSLDDVKEVIDKVTNALDDYQIIDSELGIGDAKNWLDTVSEFIKGTPQFIGATLSFLPKPILYGMYVCIFMSVVAVAVAIFKALI